MSVICSQHLSLFQRIYHTFSVSWTKDSCSLHKKLQATKICSFKDYKIWKFCHDWKNHTSSYWWTDQNYTEKGKAHGHFYSSALISIRSDLPAVLIFLFDFFKNGIKFHIFSEICPNFFTFSYFFKIYYVFLPVSNVWIIYLVAIAEFEFRFSLSHIYVMFLSF